MHRLSFACRQTSIGSGSNIARIRSHKLDHTRRAGNFPSGVDQMTLQAIFLFCKLAVYFSRFPVVGSDIPDF
jgi:hypothetical protein